MPLLPGKANVGHNIQTEESAGKKPAQATAIALHTADKSKGGEDHKAAIAKMHPEHLHKMVKAAHAGEYGQKAQQMAQQAMQGQGTGAPGEPGAAPQDGEQDQAQGGGRDYMGMFGSGGGAPEEQPAGPPNRASMFARSGGGE